MTKKVVGDHPRNTGPMMASRRCGAKTRLGAPCRSPAISGKSRCRMHGGAKGSGAPSGNSNRDFAPRKQGFCSSGTGIGAPRARIVSEACAGGGSVLVDGQRRRMPRGEALDRAILDQALDGDFRAMKFACDLRERALAEKAACEEAAGRAASVALTLKLVEHMRSLRLAEVEGPVDGHPSAMPEAEGQANEGLGVRGDRRPVGVPCEAGDPLAGIPLEEPAASAPAAQSPHPERPAPEAGDTPSPARGDAVQFGNAAVQPVAPRVRGARRASSAVPLITNSQPLTRGY